MVHSFGRGQKIERLVRDAVGPLNFEAMAIEWCKHVDGVDVWPKLPVYLRVHHASWEQNNRVRAAVREAASGEIAEEEIFAATQKDMEVAYPATEPVEPAPGTVPAPAESAPAAPEATSVPAPVLLVHSGRVL